MSDIYGLPPAARGTAEEQLQDLRNYLFRLSQQLNTAVESPIAGVESNSRAGAIINASGGSGSMAIKKETELRELILKTANEVKRTEDRITTVLKSEYVANSTFGSYTEQAQLIQEQTAAGLNERYSLLESLTRAIEGSLNDATTEINSIQGQIQRGFIRVGDRLYFGIAIADRIETTGATMDEKGLTYNEIGDGQSFGLYTAHGWMFWLNGTLAGWFNSDDGKLHVYDIEIDNSLQIGMWLMSSTGAFGIRYIGG